MCVRKLILQRVQVSEPSCHILLFVTMKKDVAVVIEGVGEKKKSVLTDNRRQLYVFV